MIYGRRPPNISKHHLGAAVEAAHYSTKAAQNGTTQQDTAKPKLQVLRHSKDIAGSIEWFQPRKCIEHKWKANLD